MPKVILYGYSHRVGTFTNQETGEVIDFDNLVLDVASDVPLQNSFVKQQGGFHVSEIKVKSNLMNSLFVPPLQQPDDLAAWCGKEISCSYVPQGNRNVLSEVRLVQK